MAKPGATPLARMRELFSVCDVLFEVRDARAPLSSRHPRSTEIFGKLPRVIVLAKKDLADENLLGIFVKELTAPDCKVLALALKQSRGKDLLLKAAIELSKEKLAARARKGMLPRPVRACVVGLPNVGKSSLINWLTGRKKAPVADRPGITRAPQWIRIHESLELLDTPGILPPVKFSGPQATKLALCNILPQDHYDPVEVATELLSLDMVARKLSAHFGMKPGERITLEDVAMARSFMAAGGVPDQRRAADILISEFRHGKLGGFVLDELSGKQTSYNSPPELSAD